MVPTEILESQSNPNGDLRCAGQNPCHTEQTMQQTSLNLNNTNIATCPCLLTASNDARVYKQLGRHAILFYT